MLLLIQQFAKRMLGKSVSELNMHFAYLVVITCVSVLLPQSALSNKCVQQNANHASADASRWISSERSVMKGLKFVIVVFIFLFLLSCGSSSEDGSGSSNDTSTNTEETSSSDNDSSADSDSTEETSSGDDDSSANSGSTEETSSNDDSLTDSGSTNTTLPQIELVGSINQSTDYSGDLILLGEVKNTGSTATFAKAKCNLFDSSSNLLETETTYIVGSVVILKGSQSNTNTALKQDEIGVFKAWTSTPASNVSSFDCSYTFDTYEIEEAQATLEIKGNVNQQSDYSEELELLGSVTNSGTTGLIFGQVIFAIKNSAGNLLDIESTYIDGETVQLTSGSTTDTALNPGSAGTFDARTDVEFSSFNSFDSYFDWSDANIQNGIVTERILKRQKLNKKGLWEERNKRINIFRDQVHN